jgi:hypothetical protein
LPSLCHSTIIAERRVHRAAYPTPATRDAFVLLLILLPLLGIALLSTRANETWRPGAPPLAPFCPPGQTPRFELGFADLAAQLGDIAGQPTECEHGDEWTPNTVQATTTGQAIYERCSNTSSFVRGREHWTVTSTGLQYWSGEGAPPPPRPIVQPANLRDACGPP